MTREEILQMPTGRALDAAVAEALGWEAYAETRGGYRLCVTRAPGEREPWMGARHPQPERYERVSCAEAVRIGFFGRGFPAFSEDVAAAWSLWQHCRDTYGEDAFAAALLPALHIRRCEYATSSTVALVVRSLDPLAICRAALLLTTLQQPGPAGAEG